MALRWYVVHAYSGFEAHVKRALAERIKLAGKEDQFGEILVPTEEVVEMKDGQKRKMLKRHLRALYGMSPDDYRAKWGLAPDYPMPIVDHHKERDKTLARFKKAKSR